MITRLLLLGATGDMAGRFALPALAGLAADGAPPHPVRVVGAGQQDWDDAAFRDHVAARLRDHAGDLPDDARTDFLAGLRYARVDPADPGDLTRALALLDGPPDGGQAGGPTGGQGDGHGGADPADDAAVAVYLALPPVLFPGTLSALARVDLPAGSRVAVEKPFGADLPSAVALNGLLADVGAEGFRVDHILGMPRVQDLQALRGPGGALEHLWDGGHVERVDVLWEEILGLGDRTDFYDRTGAVRDVLQNHALQVLAVTAMEPPATSSGRDLQRAKAAVLRAVPAPSGEAITRGTRRARYTAGTLVGPDGAPVGPVVGYADAPGVEPTRGTETFAELALGVATPRWSGTRFTLRTGKALAANRKGVALHLRPGVDVTAGSPDGLPDGVRRVGERVLWIELDGPRAGAARPHVHVNAPGELSAYRRVLTDVLTGGHATSVSADEAEESWRIVDPVLAAWRAGAVPLEEYAAGSPGPGSLR